MRGLLFLVGSLMICGGISAITYDMIGGALGASQRALEMATTDPTTLCHEGETLAEEKGASTYTQGQGYGSPVRYFCVSADATRREVTGEFADNMIGEVSQIFGSLTAFRREWLLLMGGGVVLIILAFFIRRRRPDMDIIGRGGSGSPVVMVNGERVTSSGDLAQTVQQAIQAARQQQAAQGATSSLSDKLRQLETARDNGLLTDAEYQAARQKLLDAM